MIRVAARNIPNWLGCQLRPVGAVERADLDRMIAETEKMIAESRAAVERAEAHKQPAGMSLIIAVDRAGTYRAAGATVDLTLLPTGKYTLKVTDANGRSYTDRGGMIGTENAG